MEEQRRGVASGEEGEVIGNVIPNIPVRSQTKHCTIDVLPLFLFHAIQKGEERWMVSVNRQIFNSISSNIIYPKHKE